MSTILCIDTASDRFALAVDREGSVASMEAEAHQDHSRLLLPAISELLEGDRPAAILVVIGPGAYAGIRVGIATAEGVGLALGIPLYSIGTLEAAALAANVTTGTMIHPAGRGGFAEQEWADRIPIGRPIQTDSASLQGKTLIGEGAGVLGGTEVSPKHRAEAALRDRAPKIRAGSLEAGADAFYLREPNITVSRRQQAAAS